MERLNKSAPIQSLTAAKKKEIAELNSRYQAKLAERETFLKGKIAEATVNMDQQAVEELERELASDRKTLEAELEEKKEAVRNRK